MIVFVQGFCGTAAAEQNVALSHTDSALYDRLLHNENLTPNLKIDGRDGLESLPSDEYKL